MNGKIAPKSNEVEDADLISQWGRQYSIMRDGECSGSFRGSYRQHATKGFYGTREIHQVQAQACRAEQVDKTRTIR